MSSDRFMKLAKEIASQDKPLFDSLIEFEKTGKIKSKTRMNFTIDKSIAEKFKRHSREKGYNMSLKIEQAMKELMAK